jgi:plasmid stabilization system protein ParE
LGTGKEKDQKEGLLRIKILDAAEKDLEEGYWFYEAQNTGLGSYYLDSLYADIDSLAYFGGIHRVVFGYHRMLSRRFPFAVYYRVIDEVVVVFAVLDCRRNPSWIRERLTEV